MSDFIYRLKPNLPEISCKQLLAEQKVRTFTAAGIYYYLASSVDPISFSTLDKLASLENSNEIRLALVELIDAGLVEEARK